MIPRFDAYTATTLHLSPTDAVHFLMESGDEVREGKGFHTFGTRCSVKGSDGLEVGAVSWGGKQGERVMIEVKGERSPGVVERIRAVPHRVTRMDSCVDWDEPGAWDRALGLCSDIKARTGLYGEKRGDWDQPDLGRTFYLGAPSSAVRFRLYEKGKQPEYRHLMRPDYVRAEVEIRPAKEAKEGFASITAQQAWGVSPWTREMAAQWLIGQVEPCPPGNMRREVQRDRALRFMAGQYGQHLLSLQADLGSWECLGLTLRDMVQEEIELRQQMGRVFS